MHPLLAQRTLLDELSFQPALDALLAEVVKAGHGGQGVAHLLQADATGQVRRDLEGTIAT